MVGLLVSLRGQTKLPYSVEPLDELPVPRVLLGVPGYLGMECRYLGVSDLIGLSAYETDLFPVAVPAIVVVT
ncbi:hypothetical protein TIFTF001_033721 [Ficus carica]|uniref:Uncharacterized protein n=1 Tax=Ficus carica TaxID=3494 RepID=A0AA88DZA9_FICCA|nr:hypothetical protein TIFTF001_033721 [Ficus carica]